MKVILKEGFTNKADLEAAYPEVDFTTLMTSKRWNY